MSQASSPANDTKQPDRQPTSSYTAMNVECESVLALIPSFSIGATDLDEDEFIKGKLSVCPEATAELAKYRRLAEALHYSAPPMQSPPILAEVLSCKPYLGDTGG